jgi:hypothetical protein
MIEPSALQIQLLVPLLLIDAHKLPHLSGLVPEKQKSFFRCFPMLVSWVDYPGDKRSGRNQPVSLNGVNSNWLLQVDKKPGRGIKTRQLNATTLRFPTKDPFL